MASAALARQVAADVGLWRRGADIVMSAITLHRSPDVRISDGAVAQLLSAGAAVDVIGLRSWDHPRATVAAIVERHPRLGFKRGFSAAFRAEQRGCHRAACRFSNDTRHSSDPRGIKPTPRGIR